MTVTRRFLIAPALGRLIRKERGGARFIEGYFAPRGDQVSFVQQGGSDCHLVLTRSEGGNETEERTEVPRAHGDALLDVCAGKAAYTRTVIAIGGRDAFLEHLITPAALDMARVVFDDAAAAEAFRAPLWFNTEVSSDPAYDRHAIAINGVPAQGELLLSNAALDSILDVVEPKFGLSGSRP